jgi:outer membrane protein
MVGFDSLFMRLQRCFVPLLLLYASFGLASVCAQDPGRVLTLSDAIQLALSKNYSIKVESFGTPIARADLQAAWGTFDPVLSASYTVSEDGNPQPTDPTGNRPPGTTVETDFYDVSLRGLTPWGMSYRMGAMTQNRRVSTIGMFDNYYTFAGVEITQPLLRNFGFNANLVQVRLAAAARGISEWDYRATVMDVVTEVIFAYHDLYFYQKNLEIAQRSRDLANGLVQENERRFRAGGLSEADVTAARARVATREEAILLAARAVRDQENFLKRLISDERTIELVDRTLTIAPPEPLPPISPEPALDFRRALQQRPDYQRAELFVRRADIARRYRRNQLLPRVDLVGSYGYNGLDQDFSESRRQVSDREIRSYSLGAVVSVPLTFATERGNYRSAKLTQQQAETMLEQLEQTIVVQVGNAAGQIQTAAQRVEATRLSRELEQQNLDAEVKKLRAGTGNTFFVLQQQEILANTEIRAFRALSDYQKALAVYDRQLGDTLTRHRIIIDGSHAPAR